MTALETKTQAAELASRKISLQRVASIIFVGGTALAMLAWIGFLTWIVLAVLGF
jgi:hypothetical protein